jgi:flavin reductase (DIM6/NTAB) family NADH-FMN oxidoreductase RutF
MKPDIARAMASLTTGIYVLTVVEHGHEHGMSSSWVTQVSGEPALFSVAVDVSHHSHGIIERTRVLGLNVVGARGRELEDYFYSTQARRAGNLADTDHEPSPILGVPWLARAMVNIEARVVDRFGAGDHSIFVAEPLGVRIATNDRPLTSLDLDYVYVGGREVIARDRTGW